MNDFYCFDVDINMWEKWLVYDVIEGCGGLGLVLVGYIFYVVVGFVGWEMNDVYVFDMKEKIW